MYEKQSGGINKYQYHPELISLYNSGVLIGVIIGNILTPLLFIFVLIEYIPSALLIGWFLAAAIISSVRIYLEQRLNKLTKNHPLFHRYVQYTIFSAAFSGALWGAASIMTYLFAPELHLFFLTTIIVGLISAANTSLSPIYRAYFYYVLFSVLPLMVIFFLYGNTFYIITAILILFFALFVLVGGYKHFRKLFESIVLKDRLKYLNEDLESEVKKRTLALEQLNDSLEDRVKEEIAKNRAKDQQLVQQSRMAQMGEMICMIAHQWRQPLGAIAASSIDLKMKLAFSNFDLSQKEQQLSCEKYFNRQLDNIENYVESLTHTIDDFRNFYKPNREQKMLTINEPIQKSLTIIEAAIKASGIEIVTLYESKKHLALYDSELMQVFLNILKNAQDNFKEKEIQNGQIIIKTWDTEEGVSLSISDNGGGIPEEIIDKIFDPYFSTKSEKNGTGLGLYMSKTIIEEHHRGRLYVKNREDGVEFSIEIQG
jgi:signal transduction histidine kinase